MATYKFIGITGTILNAQSQTNQNRLAFLTEAIPFNPSHTTAFPHEAVMNQHLFGIEASEAYALLMQEDVFYPSDATLPENTPDMFHRPTLAGSETLAFALGVTMKNADTLHAIRDAVKVVMTALFDADVVFFTDVEGDENADYRDIV